MEKIPPKDRFSKHKNSISVPSEILHEAISRFALKPLECQTRQLSGGFMNANFQITTADKNYVLRVYSSNMTTAQREHDVLNHLASSSVLVPKVFELMEIQGRPVLVMEYLNGITLEDKLLSGEKIDMGFYEDLGAQLAQIHKVTFSEAGFLGPKMKIGNEFQDFGVFIKQFIERTLSHLQSRTDKLDLDTNQRFLKLVQDKWNLALREKPVRQLVHTDFNPKNILVTKGSETKTLGIIDWEFCLSGDGLLDIGNFFRFYYDYPEQAEGYFIKGYQSAGNNLPPNWKEASQLLDLGNMCSFLERPEDYQESFRTARSVVQSTLRHFGY